MTKPVTLVTGASRGIGRGIAERLHRDGHHVVNLSRSRPADPFPAETWQVNLIDADATAAALEEVTARYEIDHLVNNAGFANAQTLEETALDRFQQVIDINLRAVIQCSQACLPAMKAKGRGRIVNISSRASLGKDRRTAYAAAKAGVIGMTRSWALELGPHGTTVNAIAPGPIATEMLAANNDPDYLARMAETVPVRRLGSPADIAGVVAFFLSDDAAFITGQTLYVCGGRSIGYPLI